jgi:hypothetical protein
MIPEDIEHAIFDEYVRTGRVPVERLAPWPEALAAYDGDPVDRVEAAVGQDWVAMPKDVQDRLGGVVTYSEGASVLRRRRAGFDTP